jgi:phosphoglycerate dehydrogenase-like enzyme
MPGALQATVDVQWCPSGTFAERARDGLIDGRRATLAELDAETIHAGQFGLIQQFGAGVENIDIAAATSAGVWVANMPGLNAVEVAEHAVLLQFCPSRDGFRVSVRVRSRALGRPTW